MGLLYPSIYQARSPVTRHQLMTLDDRVEYVQFDSELTVADYRLLNEWFADHPDKTLRVYGSISHLDFLSHLPSVLSFQADSLYNALESIDGLAYLASDVRYVGIGNTKRRLSLAPLARFGQLQHLYLEGQTKDIEVIGELHDLRSVTLRSITIPDLSLLLPLTRLRALDLKLGGTKNLDLLPRFAELEYLELWMVKGMRDLSPVSELSRLEYLFLQALRQVERLPDMSGMKGLRRLWIETMRGLSDLSPICSAPNIRQLAAVDMTHLQAEAFAPLVGHPTLESVSAGLGSRRKNEAVAGLIRLSTEGDWLKPRRR